MMSLWDVSRMNDGTSSRAALREATRIACTASRMNGFNIQRIEIVCCDKEKGYSAALWSIPRIADGHLQPPRQVMWSVNGKPAVGKSERHHNWSVSDGVSPINAIRELFPRPGMIFRADNDDFEFMDEGVTEMELHSVHRYEDRQRFVILFRYGT